MLSAPFCGSCDLGVCFPRLAASRKGHRGLSVVSHTQPGELPRELSTASQRRLQTAAGLHHSACIAVEKQPPASESQTPGVL